MKGADAARLAVDKLAGAVEKLQAFGDYLDQLQRAVVEIADGQLGDAAKILHAVHEQIGSETARELAAKVQAAVVQAKTLSDGVGAIEQRAEQVQSMAVQFKNEAQALATRLAQ